MKVWTHTMTFTHIPSGQRFVQTVEAVGHKDARSYANHVLSANKGMEWPDGKYKISVIKSPLSVFDLFDLQNLD